MADLTTLLEKQVRLLTELNAQQTRQHGDLTKLLEQTRSEHAQQTERIIMAIKAGRTAPPNLPEPQPVELTGLHVPFSAVFGLVLKVWLATFLLGLFLTLFAALLSVALGGGLLAVLTRGLP